MSEQLKVLMMGGRRAGKTSLLAGLVDSMVNGPVKDIVSVRDVTQYMDSTESLQVKIEHLKSNIQTKKDKVFLVDDSSTSVVTDYELELYIPGTNQKMNILFTDLNGEWFESGVLKDSVKIEEKMEEYDVFLIAIDTPYLMEAANKDNPLCTEAINKAYNFVNDMHAFLSRVDDKEGTDAKLVIFAPLKCELWVQNGLVDQVINRVEEVYSTHITALNSYKNIEVDIIPIQTAGGIVFHSQHKAYVCVSQGDEYRKCSVLDNGKRVRFANGDEREVQQTDKYILDNEAKILTTSNLMRPYSWFKVNEPYYKPRNCEQLAYYILQFFLAKVLFAREMEKAKGGNKQKKKKWVRYAYVISLFVNPWATIAFYLTSKYLERKFGNIGVEKMTQIVARLNNEGYIKRNTEGIKTLKESKLNIINK